MTTPPPTPPRLPARVWRYLVAVAVDRPVVVSAVLVGGVAAHAVLAVWPWSWLDPYTALREPGNLSTAVTIYLFTAAAAALVAALAGVILVFVISGQTPRIRVFRQQAGSALRHTWVAVIAEPFVAAFLGVIAAVTQTTAGGAVAPWVFEAGVVLLAHTALRLTLLLNELVGIVAADDEAGGRTASADDVFGSS